MGRVLRGGVVVAALTALSGLLGCAAAPAVPDVPAIEDPRDVRGIDPCALLDDEALAAAGVTGVGVAGTGPEGPRCEWRGPSGQLLVVSVFAGDGGLATLAGNSEPTTTRVRLAGYPALETFTGRGEFCQYDVGIAPDQVLLVALDGGEPDSCTVLQSLLPQVLSALPS